MEESHWVVYVTESSRFWWMHVVRGFAALGFGIVAIFWPGVTTVVLIAFLGAFALALSVFEFVEAFRLRSIRQRLRRNRGELT